MKRVCFSYMIIVASVLYMKRSVLAVVISTAASLVWINTGFADTVHLKNGNALQGAIEASNDKQVTIDVSGAGKLTLWRTEIASIEKSSPQQEAAQQTISQSDMSRAGNVNRSSPVQNY